MTPRERTDFRSGTLTLVAVVLAAAIAMFWIAAGDGATGPAAGSGTPDEPAAPRAPDAEPRVPESTQDSPRRGDSRIERTGLELHGLVVCGAGSPVAGAIVILNGPGDADHEVRSGSDGRFVVRGLVAGAHQLVACGPHFLTHSEFAEIGESSTPHEITMVVDRGLPLTGQVQDDELRPVAGARVTPWRVGPSGEELDARCAVTTDSAGRFQIWGQVMGTTFVLVEHPGFDPAKGRLEASRVGVVRLSRTK